MEPSEIKARFASLLGIPLSQITLNKKEGATPSFAFKDDLFVITYDNVNELTHEFLHACFSPRTAGNIPPLYNALEDYRMSIKAEIYDKRLAKSNSDILSDEQIEHLVRGIQPEPASETYNEKQEAQFADAWRAATAISTPVQSKIDINQLLEDTLSSENGYRESIKQAVMEARTELAANPTVQQLRESFDKLKGYLVFKDDKDNQPMPSTSSGDADLNERRQLTDQDIKQNIENKINKGTEIRLNPHEEFLLANALKKIIQNRSIGRRQNTITGKLKTKRLGRLPSEYVFVKKTTPSPQTELYILADASGSMDGSKIDTVIRFLTSVRDMQTKDLVIKARCFNNMYFKDDEIPTSYREFRDEVMCRKNPRNGYSAGSDNDDAHYLTEILNEIQQSPCQHKALLILSDGQPVPSGLFQETDLKLVAQTTLVKSGIPYMSIGIRTQSVRKFYKKYKIAYSTEQLINLLSKNTRELIKF